MTPLINPNAYENLTEEEKIGLHVFVAREQAGIPREELAKKLNISAAVLRSIEILWYDKTRRNCIKYSEIEAIAGALGCSINYLLPK
jgi:ribosome-binding protein aMBF1 (putative translation factor)